jgi:hypothetical protein
MKMNGEHEVLAKIARRSLVLVGLLAMALACAIAGRAQSSPTTASAQDAKPAAAPMGPVQTSAATAKPATAQEKSPVLAEEKQFANGENEGIKVHGHWTIEIRNRDGSVAKHVEFENNLATTNLSDMAAGPAFLYSLLSGNGTFAAPAGGQGQPGGWAINLQPPAGSTAPCAFTSNIFTTNQFAALIDVSFSPSCMITSLPSFCTLGGAAPPIDCSQGLAVTMNTSGQTSVGPSSLLGLAKMSTPTGFTLSGTVTASQVLGYVGTVETFGFINTPVNALGFTSPGLVAFQFTTHSISSMQVAQGQVVFVTVSFSFS